MVANCDCNERLWVASHQEIEMRRILSASAALLGATVTMAHAQPATAPANPSQGQLAAPYGTGPAGMNNNNAWGVANTPSGSSAAGPLSTIYPPNINAVPAPGTVVIRLNGRVEVDLTSVFTSADVGRNANGTPNGFKLNPVGVSSYFRLYPGFDGVASNGLRYGASVELRENMYAGTTGTVNGGSSGGVNSPGGNISGETIYVRRAFTYLASDNVGLARFGQTDGVIGLFDNCIFTSQCWDAGSGVFNGGGIQDVTAAAAVSIPFVWLAQTATDIGNSKVVYLSPQYYGFDFGIQYAPNEGNAYQNASGASAIQSTPCNQAGPNCISVSSGNDSSRWLNQVGVGLRWQQSFGAVDAKVYGFYETAGKEDLSTTAFTQPSPTGSTTTIRYDNLNFYKAGVAVTAMNVTAAVDYIGGAVNGSLAMEPTGGVPMNAVVAGLTYANGPWTAGVDVAFVNSQGAAQLTGVSQRREEEFAIGGNYKLAPGVQLVGEYMYTQRHQGDFNFNTGAAGQTEDAHAQGLMFSTVLTW
jgi:predicted porin